MDQAPRNDHPGPRPPRPHRELLDTVRRRAGLPVALGGIAVAAVVVSAALAWTGDDAPSQLQAVGAGPASSTVVVTTAVPVDTTTPVTTTARVAATTVVVKATKAPPTTGRTAPPTTAAATTPTAAPTTTTTSTSVPPPLCDSADVVVTVATDRSTYARGDPVFVTASAQNKGSHPCMPISPHFQFFDQTGAGVGTISVLDAAPMPGEPSPVWAPGQALSLSESWDCIGSVGCPPGRYTVEASYGPTYRPATASFTVT